MAATPKEWRWTEPAPQPQPSVSIGGYAHPVRPSKAGRFGCDPCDGCRAVPAPGARVWFTSYNDLFCDPCVTGE